MKAYGEFHRYLPVKNVKKMHLDEDFSFVVETDGYTEFGIKWYGKLVQNMQFHIAGPVKGDHGFHPDKGPRPPFIVCGPAVEKGAVLEHADLIDGAPTYAKIPGIELPNADGRVLTELLNI